MARLRKKHLEFIRASKRRNSEELKRRAAVAAACAVPAVLITVVLLHSLWQWREISIMDREAGEIESYLEREDHREAVKEARENLNELNLVNSQLMNLEHLHKIMNSYPEVDDQIASLVTESESVFIEEASFEQGILDVMAVTEDYGAVAAYIRTLEESGRFEAVVYEGFEYKEQYRFQVTCILKTGESSAKQQEGKGKS